MRRLLVLLAACTALVAMSLPAQAHRQVVEDPNDTPGKLDIKRVATKHGFGGGGAFTSPQGVGDQIISFRMGTFDEWRKRALANGRGSISFQIKRSPESSWRIDIMRAPNGNLRATRVMCIEGQGCDFDNAKTYPVTRPTNKSVKVRVPKSDLGGVGNKLRYRGETAFGTGCNGNCHFDLAPNNGLASHPL